MDADPPHDAKKKKIVRSCRRRPKGFFRGQTKRLVAAAPASRGWLCLVGMGSLMITCPVVCCLEGRCQVRWSLTKLRRMLIQFWNFPLGT